MINKKMVSIVSGTLMLGMVLAGTVTRKVSANTVQSVTTTTKIPRYVSEIHNFDFRDQDGGGQGGPQTLNKYNLNGQYITVAGGFNLWVNSTNLATLIQGALINTTELSSGKYVLTIFNKNTGYYKANDLKLVIQYTNGKVESKENAFSQTLDGYLGAEIDLNSPAHIGFQYDGAVAKSSLSFSGYSIEG